MSDFVVVDASVAFKWLVEEEHSDKATDLARQWNDEGIQLAAPPLMPFEVANALHRRVTGGDLSVEVAAGLMDGLLSLGVVLHDSPSLHRRALELANQLKQGAAYDAHYLALAESLGCELWTADRRFYRAVGPGIDNLRWIAESSTDPSRSSVRGQSDSSVSSPRAV